MAYVIAEPCYRKPRTPLGRGRLPGRLYPPAERTSPISKRSPKLYISPVECIDCGGPAVPVWPR